MDNVKIQLSIMKPFYGEGLNAWAEPMGFSISLTNKQIILGPIWVKRTCCDGLGFVSTFWLVTNYLKILTCLGLAPEWAQSSSSPRAPDCEYDSHDAFAFNVITPCISSKISQWIKFNRDKILTLFYSPKEKNINNSSYLILLRKI